MTNTLIGKTVALTLAKVWVGNNPAEPQPISGLFTLEEFCPYEPSNYCWSAGWWIVPVHMEEFEYRYGTKARTEDEISEMISLWIEADDLHEQIDPQSYGRSLEQEREMDFAEEDRDRIEANL